MKYDFYSPILVSKLYRTMQGWWCKAYVIMLFLIQYGKSDMTEAYNNTIDVFFVWVAGSLVIELVIYALRTHKLEEKFNHWSMIVCMANEKDETKALNIMTDFNTKGDELEKAKEKYDESAATLAKITIAMSCMFALVFSIICMIRG
ncbi:MAG: hypothetical protein ACRCWQ_14815 [Bacilli bacterium]